MSQAEFEYGSEGIRGIIREEAQKVVTDRLKDPMSLPGEFPTWMGSYLETAGLQVPVSQITGNTLVSDSVTELGGNTNGRLGTVRIGSTPYDFLIMSFDEVRGKWVSPPIQAPGGRGGATNNNTTYQYIDALTANPTGAVVVPYQVFHDAGLVYEVRTLHVVNVTGDQGDFKVTHHVQDAGGDTVASQGSVDDYTFSTTHTSNSVYDSGWRAKPGGLGVAATVAFDLQAKITNAASAWVHLNTTFQLRWVSI